MKKNDWSILLSVLLYSILFYRQTAGINFLIFNLSIVGLLLYRNKSLVKNKVWLSVAFGTLLSSFCIFMYGSALAIWADLFSLFILSAVSIDPRTSFLTGIFLTICSTGSSCTFMFIDWVRRKKAEASGEYKRPFYVKLFLIVVPLLIALLFFFFYQTSNPLFYEFTKNINLDFISVLWLFFTYSGLLLMYGFFYNLRIKGISDTDANASMELTPERAARKGFINGFMRIDTEAISGVVLFCMLNLLLLLLNFLDLHYLWFDGKLPQGINPKEFVHDGVGTLITSIIVAIIIIMYYFRGTLNFYKQSKWIKIMAYSWIVQNIFMILSTAYRNNLYIQESGLSYKKIGVYVYLVFVLVGLVTTFIKVWKVKTNWYLFRTNAAVYYYLLVLACVFNWDVIITDYNIKKYTQEGKALEKYLLLDLSYKNLPQLLALPDSVANANDYKARDYYYNLRGVYFYDFKSGLGKKLNNFLEEYGTMEWPSACSEKNRVFHDLVEMKEQVHSLSFKNNHMETLSHLKMFDNISELDLSGNLIEDYNEFKQFPYLKKLSLKRNQLTYVDDLPSSLLELDLSGNTISDLHGLSALKNLEVLNVSGGNHIVSFAPLLELKHLKKLTIGYITESGLDSLKHTFPNTQIIVNEINPNSEAE